MELFLFAFLCIQLSLALPPPRHTAKRALFPRPERSQGPGSKHVVQQQQQVSPAAGRELVNTVLVTCLPDSLEIVIKADMFGVGAPVAGDELRLGVENSEACRVTVSSGDEYRIVVGLMDCGTKHWMTENALVYTNLLIYSPTASPGGLIRMDEAVVPIECHYERKYSLSSSALTPTWLPFMSTQAAEETLEFDLRIMTDDWLYARSSNVLYLGEPINMEASVRVGHHMELRVFVTSCVATLTPDVNSVPRYVFVDNGCLVDSQLPGSRSHFLPRSQDDKLHMVIDAFKFHNEERGQLYISCHLNAVPVDNPDASDKACTSVNGRWRSADGNDYLCGYCQNQHEAGKTQSKPSNVGKFGPRGFGQPESLWRSGLKTNQVWEQEASVGPVLVLPAHKKSGSMTVEELPAGPKISRPTLYGSRWRSGMTSDHDLKQGLLPDPLSTAESDKDTSEAALTDGEEENDADAPLRKESAEVTLTSKGAVPNNGTSSAAGDAVRPTTRTDLDVSPQSKATTADADLSDTDEPKRK